MSESGSLQKILANWREWPLPITAPPRLLGPVPGGRTNRNFEVRVPGMAQHLILRINNPRAKTLGINRQHEAQIVHSLAQANIAPEPVYRDPDELFALLPFIKARTWQAEDFSRPEQRKRLMTLLNRVRAINPPTPRRSYLAYLDHYWEQLVAAHAADSELTQAWLAFRPRLAAFDQAGWPAQLTHHDLIPDNVLDTGRQLYLIDWEYAALGHSDIDRWSIDPALVNEPFIHDLAGWTNDLWERVVKATRNSKNV